MAPVVVKGLKVKHLVMVDITTGDPPGAECVNTLASGHFWGFLKKNNTETHVALHGNFSRLVSATDLVEASKVGASVLVRTLKKFFWVGAWIVCE